MRPSKNPQKVIQELAYKGQPENRKMYRSGYEQYYQALVDVDESDMLFQQEVQTNIAIMKALGARLANEDWYDKYTKPKEFARTILGIGEPQREGFYGEEGNYVTQSAPQIMLGHMGAGLKTPVHGHGKGFMYEQVVKGNVKIDRFHLVDPSKDVVRLSGTNLYKSGDVFGAAFNKLDERNFFERQYNIHQITALQPSQVLVHFPEYARDSINSQFTPEYFETKYMLNHVDIDKILPRIEMLQLRPGDVLLIQSDAINIGPHFFLITKGFHINEFGLRPNGLIYSAPQLRAQMLIDFYKEKDDPTTLLKLHKGTAEAFRIFHGINVLPDGTVKTTY
jgi:hypothetical protein